MSVIVPPIKSQGIKTKLVPWINDVILQSGLDLPNTNWIEPFFGTGVVGLNAPVGGNRYVADSNPHIINFYNGVLHGEITPQNMREYLEHEGALLAVADEEGCGKESEAGYNNKMFVKPELMPHQIRITKVRIERLQDISDEDVMKEGFCCSFDLESGSEIATDFFLDYQNGHISDFCPQTAYSKLIDSISSKKTWSSNPFVFVYDFELVK